MAGANRVTVVGRSLRDIAAIWGSLRSFYLSADLIVAANPVDRALGEPGRDDMAVYVLIDLASDFDDLNELEEAPEWLFALCTAELLQRIQPRLDIPTTTTVPLLPVEDLHLALMGRQSFSGSPHNQTQHRERL